MIFFVTGASGAGKSACMPGLSKLLPDFACHDFDELGVPANADKVWRQRTTQAWLSRGSRTAWQRVHVVDPQWRPDVITQGAAPEMHFQRWGRVQRGDARWSVHALSAELAAWTVTRMGARV